MAATSILEVQRRKNNQYKTGQNIDRIEGKEGFRDVRDCRNGDLVNA